MKLTPKQKGALEKITGRPWDVWNRDAVRAYFAFTDRGQHVEVPEEAKPDFEEIMEHHHWHSVTIEMWKQDFKKGLLFLSDFVDQGYPDSYVRHAFEIYFETMGHIPAKYRQYWEGGSNGTRETSKGNHNSRTY